jgi:transcriptional regulator with XRE-family HTH domain
MGVFAEKLGLTIKLKRTSLRMKQDDLGKLSEINQSHLSKIEIGSVNVSVLMLHRIATAFKCSMSDLLVDVDTGGDGKE